MVAAESERNRWTDDRLDDLAQIVRAQRDLPGRVAELAVRVDDGREDINSAFRAIREVAQKLDKYIEDQVKREEDHRLERKQDRRWFIGTMIACASLIIAAVALIVQGI